MGQLNDIPQDLRQGRIRPIERPVQARSQVFPYAYVNAAHQ